MKIESAPRNIQLECDVGGISAHVFESIGEFVLRTVVLLATAAFLLAVCLEIYAPGAGVAPQASPYALAPASFMPPFEGRAAFVERARADSAGGAAAQRNPNAP